MFLAKVASHGVNVVGDSLAQVVSDFPYCVKAQQDILATPAAWIVGTRTLLQCNGNQG